jgi:transcriptional regulator of acetoin/glycerol metabolism
MTALTRSRRELDSAWHSFVLDGRASHSVKPEILRSWQRSAAKLGVDPALRVCPPGLTADELTERARADEAFRIATELISEFGERLSPDGHILTYFDGDGVMLSAHGDAHRRELLAQINFAPGARWTEQAAGTNGVGTALVESRAVEVFASEHFVAAWQPWTCASVPVRDAGRVVGVVDITSPWEARHPSLIVCAGALARAIEARLDSVASQRTEIIREALRRGDRLAWLGLDARGKIVATGPASSLSTLDAAALSPSALASVIARLRREGATAGEFEEVLEVDGRSVRVLCMALEHEGRAIGGVLRIASGTPVRGKLLVRPSHSLYGFEDILGSSPALVHQVALARTAARNALPVLILGESGTGKELFAQAIHSAGERARGPFVAVNCGAIPQSLLEAELFGYEAGSFTGGRKEGNTGRFEDAEGGTLFLDEVSELPPTAQAALLRVLQEREVTRIGSSTPRRLDVRIIAATNKDLREEIRVSRFRQDLFFRLDVLVLELPALRDRREDVPAIAEHYLAEAQAALGRSGLGLSPDATAALAAHAWPGNIRELKNVVERTAATAPGPEIAVHDLPAELRPMDRGEATARRGGEELAAFGQSPGALALPVDPLEEEAALRNALEAFSWNVVRAARALGISRRTMYRKLEKYGISRG